MQRFITVLLLFFVSCTPVRKAVYKAEDSHNALYRQKALIVYDRTSSKVFLTNPASTRCYFLKGKKYVTRWEPGDTMIIDSNLVDFYNIRYGKCQQ